MLYNFNAYDKSFCNGGYFDNTNGLKKEEGTRTTFIVEANNIAALKIQ